MPYLASNIPEEPFYGTIAGEIIRTVREQLDLEVSEVIVFVGGHVIFKGGCA